jgi:hypothetical protein
VIERGADLDEIHKSMANTRPNEREEEDDKESARKEKWARWTRKCAILAVVSGVAVLVARSSTRSIPEPEAGRPEGFTASSPYRSTPEKQRFDLHEDPNFTLGLPMRPMDHDIFAAIADGALERKRLPDLFADRPYRVRLVGSVAERHFGMVMIDLERDGSWDERWDLQPGQVLRDVKKDDAAGGQPVRYTLAHGRWQPH